MPEMDTGAERPSFVQASQDMMFSFYRSWEKMTWFYLSGVMRNAQLLDVTGKSFETSLQMKQQADRLVEATVSNMQLATRSDMDLVLRRLTELEALMREMNAKLDDVLAEKERT